MPTSAVVSGTPCYVLMDGNRRIGPRVLQLRSGLECAPVYGFSDKGSYEEFCTNSQMALTPYPLVTMYLRAQAGIRDDRLKLIVLDAPGPGTHNLHAATLEAVLEAQENRMTHMTAGYRLIFDHEADAYRVDEAAG